MRSRARSECLDEEKTLTRMAMQSGSSLVAVLRQRCPRCRQGPIFGRRIRMNEQRPQCGLRFEREQGYFLGAMYFSYALSIAILGLLILAGYLLLPSWRIEPIIGLSAVAYIPFMVPVFRCSRVLWIYFERWANPNF
jgi:uncharacterized protein (DUF983 family)